MSEVRVQPINAADEVYFRRHFIESNDRRSSEAWALLCVLFAAYAGISFVTSLPRVASLDLGASIVLLLIAAFAKWHASSLSRQEKQATEYLASSNGVTGRTEQMFYKPDYAYVVRDGKPIGRLSGEVPQFGSIQWDRSYARY